MSIGTVSKETVPMLINLVSLLPPDDFVNFISASCSYRICASRIKFFPLRVDFLKWICFSEKQKLYFSEKMVRQAVELQE